MQIPRRAERQSHAALSQTFVDIGPLSATLARSEHQVIYGRRGTGKTHALGNLQTSLEQAGTCVVNLDLRTIGSAGGMYADPDYEVSARASRLLVDVIEAVHNELFDFTLTCLGRDEDVTGLVAALDHLAETATQLEVHGSIEREDSIGNEVKNSNRSSIGFDTPKLGAHVSLEDGSEKKLSRSSRQKVTGELRVTIKFGPLSNALKVVVKHLPGAQLWLLLDEWSDLPMELQPILADLLRRAVFPVKGLTVKIAAIERRSRFAVETSGGGYLGIELGADASQDVNLDDYLMFSAYDERAKQFFGDLFLRHVSAIYPVLADEFPMTAEGRKRFIWYLWEGSFLELVQAAEGVPRDGINIAGLAAQSATPPTEYFRGGIGIRDVRQASRTWFLRDKEGAIRSRQKATRALANITAFVADRRKRTFLIERGHDSGHEVIQDLYDARLIHLLASGVGPRGNYDLFALDYGGYVNILANDENGKDWIDLWAVQWSDIDPARSPLVRKAVIRVNDLIRRVTPSVEN